MTLRALRDTLREWWAFAAAGDADVLTCARCGGVFLRRRLPDRVVVGVPMCGLCARTRRLLRKHQFQEERTAREDAAFLERSGR